MEGLSAAILDRRAFIRDNTRLLRPPLAPRLRLYLADEAVALWQKTEEELGRIGLPPPFWAFAWAGGQALAGFLAERTETVAGKFVLDFASGSGLVAIAAAKAGAARVEASEIDDFALTAIEMNARENDVTIDVRSGDLVGVDDGWDVVLAGDISYQREMAEAATAWLERPRRARRRRADRRSRPRLSRARSARVRGGIPGAGDARAGGCGHQEVGGLSVPPSVIARRSRSNPALHEINRR